jgi:hypothetical protein
MASSRTPYHHSRPFGRSEASSLASRSDTVPLPKKCPALYRTHYCSSAIPIQWSSSVVAKLEEIIDLVPDYDKATWRMYNRIVEYR